MGNTISRSCSTSTAAMNASISTSRSIDKQIKIDQKRMKKEVKLLLLGTSEIRIIAFPHKKNS